MNKLDKIREYLNYLIDQSEEEVNQLREEINQLREEIKLIRKIIIHDDPFTVTVPKFYKSSKHPKHPKPEEESKLTPLGAGDTVYIKEGKYRVIYVGSNQYNIIRMDEVGKTDVSHCYFRNFMTREELIEVLRETVDEYVPYKKAKECPFCKCSHNSYDDYCSVDCEQGMKGRSEK